MLLGLEVAECPAGQGRYLAGQRPDASDDRVDLRAEDEVVVQLVVGLGPEAGPVPVVGERGERTAVPEHSVAGDGNDDRGSHLQVLLVQVLLVSAVVEDAFFVLAR